MSLLSKRQKKKRYVLLDDEDIKESIDKDAILTPCTENVQDGNVCEKDLFSDGSVSMASSKSETLPSSFKAPIQTLNVSEDVSKSALSDSSEKKKKKTVKSKKKRQKSIVEQSTNEEILAWSHLFSAENLESCEPSEAMLEDMERSLKVLSDNQVEQTDELPRFNAWRELINQVVPKTSHVKRIKIQHPLQNDKTVSEKTDTCLPQDSHLNDVPLVLNTNATSLKKTQSPSIPFETLKSSETLWEDDKSQRTFLQDKDMQDFENHTIDPDSAMDEFNFQLNEEYDSYRQERLQRLEAHENLRKKLISEHEKYRAKHLLLTTLKHLCPHYLLWTEKNRLCDDEGNDPLSSSASFTVNSGSSTLKKCKRMVPPCVALPFSCQVSAMALKKRLPEEDQQNAAAELHTQWCNKTHSSRKWCLVEGFLCPAAPPTNYRERFCQKLDCQWLTTEIESCEWLNKKFAKEQLQKEFPDDMEYLNKLIEPSENDLFEIDSLLNRIKKFRRWKCSNRRKRSTQSVLHDTTYHSLCPTSSSSGVLADDTSPEFLPELKSSTDKLEISVQENLSHETLDAPIQSNFKESTSLTGEKKLNALQFWLQKKLPGNPTRDTDLKQHSVTCSSQMSLDSLTLESPELAQNTGAVEALQLLTTQKELVAPKSLTSQQEHFKTKEAQTGNQPLELENTLETTFNENTILESRETCRILETTQPGCSMFRSSALCDLSVIVLPEKTQNGCSQPSSKDTLTEKLKMEKCFSSPTPHKVNKPLSKLASEKDLEPLEKPLISTNVRCFETKKKKSFHFVETYADEGEIDSDEKDPIDSDASPLTNASLRNTHAEEEEDENEEGEEDTKQFLDDLICSNECPKTEFECNARELLNEQLEEDLNKKYKTLFTLEGLKERRDLYQKKDLKLTRRQIARQEEQERENEEWMQEELELEALVEDVVWKRLHGKKTTLLCNTSKNSDSSSVTSSASISSVSPKPYRFGSKPFVSHSHDGLKEGDVGFLEFDPGLNFTSIEKTKSSGPHVEQCHPAFSFETPEEDPFLASIFRPLEKNDSSPSSDSKTSLSGNPTNFLRLDSVNVTSLHDFLSLNSRSFSKRYSKTPSETQTKCYKSFKEQLYGALLSEDVLNEKPHTFSPPSNVS